MTEIKQKKLGFRFLFFVLLLAIGCLPSKKDEEQLTVLKMFSIELYFDGKSPVITQTSDGYHGKIFYQHLDTIYYNFGYDIDNLSEKEPVVVYFPFDEADIRRNLDTSIVNPDEINYTKKSNFDIDEFKKQNIFFKKISGYNVKLTVPIKFANSGITGVYVDSLREDGGGRLKFNLYSKNLDSIQNTKLLESISSIKFHLN